MSQYVHHNDTTSPEEIWVLCRVPRHEIFFLRYNLDAYEGVAVSTTLPGGEGLVRIFTDESQRKELEELLISFEREIDLEVVEWGKW